MDNKKIEEIKENLYILNKSRDFIITTWTSHPLVHDILFKHNIELDMFQVTYAHPVLNYFIGVIDGSQEIGNCPIMVKLIAFLKESGITTSELFAICINFRKSVVKSMFRYDLMSEDMYDNISYIFDANFMGVLDAYEKEF
ncbi:hypothetical protein JHD48_02100 [Sulfurimonas sp. SAG-AH-194-I05]|nr:hypothetical protein [Sulfurimonas sp. SAG-AH-194-I05]MDF1874520.1 hypothetical protein [Sulfurimonas sp. SAG-AH-194-I05]